MVILGITLQFLMTICVLL